MLRDYVARFGTGPDGRTFPFRARQLDNAPTWWQVWQKV
jgi:hypothetical protein